MPGHHNRKITKEIEMDDPSKLNDTDLIFAMGTHDDDCECLWCVEWHRRRATKVEEG